MKRYLVKDQLLVKIYKHRSLMGKAAACDVSNKLKEILSKKSEVNIVFAAAPSQDDFLAELIEQDIDWSKIRGFHLDEYIGLGESSTQKFSRYLSTHIFNKVSFKEIHLIETIADTPQEQIKKYSELLKTHPLDIACIGVGENGHIAFNDPDVADFSDPENIKKVTLDEKCRRQQVNDGCFDLIEKVPKYAITLTIPTIMSADYIFCVVPTKNKSHAVDNCINGQINIKCPASVLRSHQRAIMYLDSDAAGNL